MRTGEYRREAGQRASQAGDALISQPRVSRDPCARCGVPGHTHGGERHEYAASIGTRF